MPSRRRRMGWRFGRACLSSADTPSAAWVRVAIACEQSRESCRQKPKDTLKSLRGRIGRLVEAGSCNRAATVWLGTRRVGPHPRRWEIAFSADVDGEAGRVGALALNGLQMLEDGAALAIHVLVSEDLLLEYSVGWSVVPRLSRPRSPRVTSTTRWVVG